jgi:MFS transporter, SP family, arabinose:H+ symporter
LTPTRSRLRWYLIIAAVVSFLGGLLFGYDNIVISGAIGYLRLHFSLDVVGTGWAASCALIGCIAGSACAGTVVDSLGHKKGLFLCAACFALSSIGIWFAGSFTQFAIWRMIAGLGIGAASIAAPMYIAEIGPTRYRGRLVTLYQLGIVVGALSAVFSNMLIQRMGDEIWNTSVGWRWMFLVGVVPALLFAIMIVPSVESPRWLMKMGRTESARDVLLKTNDPAEVSREIVEIQESLALEQGAFLELFTTFRRPLLLGIMLAGLNQVSGITPVFSFLPEIFQIAGTATRDAFFQSVLVGLVNLGFTLFALMLIDRAGRKTLIMAGTTVQFISFALLGWLFYSHHGGLSILVCVMTFVSGHALGNGVAVWVVISEIYPTKFRGRGMSIAITTLWITGFLGNQLFPVMQKDLGADGTFWCFGLGALMTVVLTGLLIPETKGLSLEEITRFWIS